MSEFQSSAVIGREYGNPLSALIAREEKTCAGCVWSLGKITFGDESLCAKMRLMRKRCKHYVDVHPYLANWRERNAKAA